MEIDQNRAEVMKDSETPTDKNLELIQVYQLEM